MANFLLTGGAGFIGSALARKLLEDGNTVTILDNLSTGFLSNIPQKANFIEGDCSVKSDVNRLSDKKFDAIIFRNLLEHIYDINSFMSLVSTLLKKDGSIYIDLPNISTTESYGGYGLFFHQHISYFSINTINKFLTNHNFLINNFYDGSPNLFIHASKHNEIKGFDKKSSFDYKNLLLNNKRIENKINSFFDNESDISLFGASALATTILCNINQSQKNKVREIFDNEKIKHFKILQGTNIEISDPIKIIPNDTKYLITSYFFDDEISDQLMSYGISKNNIIKINDLIL